MAFNGSGTFLINTAGQPVVAGTVISSTTFNSLTADLATGLSTVITKDGQTTVTANIPMASFKFTGLGVGSAAGDSANLSQVQSTVTKLLASVSGADTVTATASPTLAAYAAGQMFYFVAAGDNTTSVTLNIDALGAKAVTRDGSVALAAADIKSGEVVVVVYDGTRFQVVSQLNSAGNATFANVSITSALNVGGVATFSAGSAAAPSITTTGDTNTGLFFPAADTIAFTEGGVESMRIDSSGQVGIGTASPVAKLSVQDASAPKIALQVGSAERAFLSYTESTAITRLDSDSVIVFATNNTEVSRFDVSGNLGIGTASPAVKLQVAGAIRSSSSVTGPLANLHTSATNPASTGASGAGLNFGYDSNGEICWIQANRNDITETRGLLLNPNGGNLGIGTASPADKLDVYSTIRITGSTPLLNLYDTLGSRYGYLYATTGGLELSCESTGSSIIKFLTAGSERARITAAGDLLVGKTSSDAATNGCELRSTGSGIFTANGINPLLINRNTSDGTLVLFRQDNIDEGNISVSGSTVSYNGGHLSRYSQTTDNTQIPLLKGTVMTNLDQMAVWEKDGQPLPNEQLNCMQVSDVEGDVNVAGVFVNWDNDDDVYTNDMNIAMTGDMIIRIAQGVTVQRGDLLMSAGDGTAKPQGDDIIRSKTVAKVTSNHFTCTYEDGSYCVPCVLMAC